MHITNFTQVFFGDLTEIKDGLVQRIEDALRRIPVHVAMADQVRAARAQLIARFGAYEEDLQATVNRMLSVYRDANRSTRKTRAPVHFADRWRLPHSATNTPAAIVLRADPEDVTREQMDAILCRASRHVRGCAPKL